MAFDLTPSSEHEREEPSLAERVRVGNLIWSLMAVVALAVLVMVFKPHILSAMLWVKNQF